MEQRDANPDFWGRATAWKDANVICIASRRNQFWRVHRDRNHGLVLQDLESHPPGQLDPMIKSKDAILGLK
jgi:hypothetical protein